MAADTGAGGVNHATTGATGGIHQLDAPEKTNPPYLIFQEASDVANYAFSNALKTDHVFYMVRAFAVDANAGGATTVAILADRLKALFTNPAMTVTGKSLLSCRFDRSFPPVKERDKTNQRWLYSRGVLVEVWLG